MSVQTDEGTFARLQDELLSHYGVRATSRFVGLREPAMRAHVLEAGEGEPAVFLHGGDGEAVNWAPLMAELQRDLHLYGVDRPGFGLSDPFDYRHVDLRHHAGDFVTSLLDALGLESAIVMGGSMGGFFALVTALDHPERVRRLVLVGMPAGFTPDLPLPLRIIFGLPVLPRLLMRRAATMEGQRRQYRQMFNVDPDTVPELYFRTRIAGVERPGAQATWVTLLRRLTGPRGYRPGMYVGDELPHIKQPTLVIFGDGDMVPAEAGREATERIPNGTFAHLEDVGHFPFLEAPLETARLIRNFVGGSDAKTRGVPGLLERFEPVIGERT
jgi:pimeloyl-ACP methyl ester carboxylesterase